jgi:hypothetical protein
MAQSQSKTLATLTTTFLVAGEDADMVIGFQSGDMYLALQRELPIGSPISIAYWLKEQYAAAGDGIDLLCPISKYPDLGSFQTAYAAFKKDADGKDAAAIKRLDLYKNISDHLKGKIPDGAKHIMISAILAEVALTDLIFQQKEGTIEGAKVTTTKAKLGLTINFTAPLVLLPSLAVRKIALLIMYASNGDLEHFPVRDMTKLPSPVRDSIPAEGWIDFGDHALADKDKIILGKSDWTFVKGTTGDSSKRTTGIDGGKETALSQLVKGLNESQDEEIRKCKYELVEGTKLKITAQVGGSARNEFKLAVAPAGWGKLSGDSLTGGVGPLTKEAVPLPA